VLGIHREKEAARLCQSVPSAFGQEGRKRCRPPEDKVEAVALPHLFWGRTTRLSSDATPSRADKTRSTSPLRGATSACCAMPAWSRVDLNAVRARARHNFERLIPYVERRAKSPGVNPTCSMSDAPEYPTLVRPEIGPLLEKLARATRDV